MNNFSLNAPVASNSNADPKDVLKVKHTLNQAGYMDEPSYGIDDMPDQPMIEGIKKVQKDHGLKVDGIMKPGGETEKTFQTLTLQNQTGSHGIEHVAAKKPLANKPPAKPAPIPTLKERFEPGKDPKRQAVLSNWDQFKEDYMDIVYGDQPAGLSQDPDADYGFYRPKDHKHVVGTDAFKKNAKDPSILSPKSPIMNYLEDTYRGMHTTGTIHDEVVDRMRAKGWDFDAINFQTMVPSFLEAYRRELLNLTATLQGKAAPYKHDHREGK